MTVEEKALDEVLQQTTKVPPPTRMVLTDIGLCGVKAGVSFWRTTTEEDYHIQVKLRSGTWDELTKDEMLDVARDLTAAAVEMDRLAAQAGR